MRRRFGVVETVGMCDESKLPPGCKLHSFAGTGSACSRRSWWVIGVKDKAAAERLEERYEVEWFATAEEADSDIDDRSLGDFLGLGR